MLDLRKLESGNITIVKKQGDIVKYLRYLTEALKSYAETKNLNLHFLSDELQLLMDFDREKITRIHTNLLSNAIKFTPENGDIYVQIHVEKELSNRQFVLKIRDTGVGIPAEQLPYIFQRFYQVDDSSTRQGEGTGIGLTLVAELIKAMDGKVKVSSTVAKGTTFTISLAITNRTDMDYQDFDAQAVATGMVDAAVLTTPLPQVSKHQLPTTAEKPSVLLVEDNADVVHYLVNCLKVDYQIDIAVNGAEGIEKAIEQVSDIIVSDVMMPIKDGFELCQTLKTDERTSHIPIILLTAKADIESRLQGLQKGADAYLSKPFHKEELLIILQKQLELRKKLQERYAQTSDIFKASDTLPKALKENLDLQIEDAFLQKIRALIEKDLTNGDIGIPQLIRGLGMSRSQIYKKVKALTGHSPSVYVRSIRLFHAQRLLKAGELNVSEVAYEVGFSSPVYFSDVYLKEFGVRPSEVAD